MHARQTAAPTIPAMPPSPARPSGGTLPTVRRGGYDRDAVDTRLSQLSGEHARLSSGLSTAQGRIGELEAALDKARTELDENKNPSYAGLGGRATSMLRLAEEEAGEVRVTAERDAAEIRGQAQRDAQAVRADATREAEDMRLVQLKELDETRARILADAEQERSLARSEAADVLASAQREADQLRLAAQQETNELRVGAKREAEQVRAAADREVQEARRTLAVEKERLAREATDHHTSATAETGRLVSEAEARATSAEQRAREAIAQAQAHREQAHTESEATLSRARREAEQIVSLARSQADSVNTTAQADAERQLAVVRAEVDRMTKRREAITAQLASLRDVVEGFGGDDDGTPAPSTTARSPRAAATRPALDAPPCRRTVGRRGAEGTETPTRPDEAEVDLGRPGPRFDRHSPFYIGFFGGLGFVLAGWLFGQIERIGSVLILIVVSLFIAAGLNPSVEWFQRRGHAPHLRGDLRDRDLPVRRRAVPAGDRAGHHRPGHPDHRQRARLARPAPEEPEGPGPRRPVRRHRQGPRLRAAGQLRLGHLRWRRSASASGCSARWPTPSSSWC